MLPLDCVTPPPSPLSRYRYIDRSTGRSILIGFVRRRCDARRRHTREIIHNHRVVWMLGRGGENHAEYYKYPWNYFLWVWIKHLCPILDSRMDLFLFFFVLRHLLSGDIDFKRRDKLQDFFFFFLLSAKLTAWCNTCASCISDHVIMHSRTDSLIDFQGPCKRSVRRGSNAIICRLDTCPSTEN